MPELPEGQHMWIAYLGEVRRVRIVAKGCGETVFKPKQKPRNPYVIYDEVDEEEFVMALSELHHNPREAQIAMAELSKKHGVEVPAPSLEENPLEEGEEEEDEEDPESEEEEESEWEEGDEEE